MQILQKFDIDKIKIDKNQDIIPITVGLYRLFMASGAAGREAKDLYEHLIFTARLQETQQVRANNVYLARGLSWGLSKVKAAKAWLVNAGLIDYVRTRQEGGQLGDVYIRLSYLPRAETVASRMITEEEPAGEEEYHDDLTPDMFTVDDEVEYGSAVEPNITTGSEIEPLVTTGSIHHPVADQAPGAKQQMLKVNNEMLKVKKEKGEDAPAIESKQEQHNQEQPHFEIPRAWYNRYAKETAIIISPRPDDNRAAADLYSAIGGDLSALDLAVDAYFSRFRELDFWYAAKKSSRRGDPSKWIPDWSFRGFLAHYPEIVASALLSEEKRIPDKTPGPLICPVCGSPISGTMSTCGVCGLSTDDIDNQEKIEKHREWYDQRQRGQFDQISISAMFHGIAQRGEATI